MVKHWEWIDNDEDYDKMYNKTYSRSFYLQPSFSHLFIHSFITSNDGSNDDDARLHVKYDYSALIGNDNAWEICHFMNLHLRNIHIIALDTRTSILYIHTYVHTCVYSQNIFVNVYCWLSSVFRIYFYMCGLFSLFFSSSPFVDVT